MSNIRVYQLKKDSKPQVSTEKSAIPPRNSMSIIITRQLKPSGTNAKPTIVNVKSENIIQTSSSPSSSPKTFSRTLIDPKSPVVIDTGAGCVDLKTYILSRNQIQSKSIKTESPQSVIGSDKFLKPLMPTKIQIDKSKEKHSIDLKRKNEPDELWNAKKIKLEPNTDEIVANTYEVDELRKMLERTKKLLEKTEIELNIYKEAASKKTIQIKTHVEPPKTCFISKIDNARLKRLNKDNRKLREDLDKMKEVVKAYRKTQINNRINKSKYILLKDVMKYMDMRRDRIGPKTYEFIVNQFIAAEDGNTSWICWTVETKDFFEKIYKESPSVYQSLENEFKLPKFTSIKEETFSQPTEVCGDEEIKLLSTDIRKTQKEVEVIDLN